MMIDWFRRLFRRPQLETPNVSEVVDRLRGSRADALQVQKETRHNTKILRLDFPMEADIFPPIPKRKSGGQRT